jgi:hypothetical protein
MTLRFAYSSLPWKGQNLERNLGRLAVDEVIDMRMPRDGDTETVTMLGEILVDGGNPVQHVVR